MSDTAWRVIRPYGDNRWCLFVGGRLTADWRPSGRCWKVRQFLANSLMVYRETLVSSRKVARVVAFEFAESLPDSGAPD